MERSKFYSIDFFHFFAKRRKSKCFFQPSMYQISRVKLLQFSLTQNKIPGVFPDLEDRFLTWSSPDLSLNVKQDSPPYLSDLGLVFFCLGADLDAALESLGRVSADIPPPDCSPILCLSYSRRTTSGREGGGWNVTGAFIGAGSSLESVLVFLRPVEFFLSKFKRRFYIFLSPFLQ